MAEEIAAMCNLDIETGKLHFPKFDIPHGETDYGYLSKLVMTGTSKKYGSITPKIRIRLEQELDTIDKLGFCG